MAVDGTGNKYVADTLNHRIRKITPAGALLPAAVTGLERDSKAQAEQVHSVSIDHLGSRIGMLGATLLADLDEALRFHLALLQTIHERRFGGAHTDGNGS